MNEDVTGGGATRPARYERGRWRSGSQGTLVILHMCRCRRVCLLRLRCDVAAVHVMLACSLHCSSRRRTGGAGCRSACPKPGCIYTSLACCKL